MLAANESARMGGLDRGGVGLTNPQGPRKRRPMVPGTAPMAPAPQPQQQQMTPAPAPVPAPAPAPLPAPAQPPAPTLKGVSVQGIDPTADLRNSTIAPTNDVNRFDLMDERIKNYDATQLPQFQAKVRGIAQGNAAQGRLGSGMMSTDLGNLDLATENARNSYFGDLLAGATEGTIGDSANNRDELRTERGYQTGQERDAFDRSRQEVMDSEALKSGQFGRDYATAQMGFGNDPSQLMATLAQMSGQNASAGAAGIGASSANQQYLDLLRKMAGQGVPSAGPQPTPPLVKSGDGIKPKSTQSY